MNAKKRNQWIKRIVILVVVVGLFCGVYFYGLPMLKAANAVTATSTTTYQVQEVTSGKIETSITGSGTLTPVKTLELTASYNDSTVKKIYKSAGTYVKKGTKIARVYNSKKGYEYIKAPYAGIIVDINVSKGDTVGTMDSICTFVRTYKGFTMNISIDEEDIALVKKGQEVTFTVDALGSETYTGKVTYISYAGNTSNSGTTYTATAKMDYVSGLYPKMSATAEIIISSSAEGLMVPVDAVYTSGDTQYVYLAPEGSEMGTVYQEDELDASTLQRVTVTTGMSNGSYILVESDQLSEGSKIILTKLTSNKTSSSSSSSSSGFDFSGMGGFDPSSGGMPSFPSGGGSGNSGGSGSFPGGGRN